MGFSHVCGLLERHYGQLVRVYITMFVIMTISSHDRRRITITRTITTNNKKKKMKMSLF